MVVEMLKAAVILCAETQKRRLSKQYVSSHGNARGPGEPPMTTQLRIASGQLVAVSDGASASTWIECDGGTFTHVGPNEPGGRSDRRLDASGLFLLPGLIDAHVHPGIPTPMPGANDVSAAEIAALLFQHCSEMLDAGFTTVRYTGGVDAGLVRAVARGTVRGPRIITAGPVLCQCGGHGDYSPTFSDGTPPLEIWKPGLVVFAQVCDGEDGVRRAVRNAFRQGASFIKMCVTGGVVSASDELDDTQFTVPEIRAAVEEARARGTYVTVHAHGNAGIRNALEAGALGIEHGTGLNEENATLMAASGATLVPTLSVVANLLHDTETGVPGQNAVGVDPATVRSVQQGMQEAIKVALAAGVTVGAGSDLIGPHQVQRGREVLLRSEVTDAVEALRAVTEVNAGVVRRPELGRVVVGAPADLIGLRADPVSDPGLLTDPDNVVLVIKGGVVVKDTEQRAAAG